MRAVRCAGLILSGLLALLPASHAAQGPKRIRPSHADYLVLELPETGNEGPSISKSAAANHDAAAREAVRLIQLARTSRDQRYYGRAEAMLRPWLVQPDPAPVVLRLQADILQNRHDFAGALRMLDRAIAAQPRDAQARLMRATVSLVQGDPMRARADCAALMGLGETAPGTVCLAQSLAATGSLDKASEMINLLFARGAFTEPATRAWARSSLGDIAARNANLPIAEHYLRGALVEAPQDETLRCALSDILLARKAADEALALLDLPHPSAGVLVRRVLAQSILGNSTARRAAMAELNELLRLEQQRGERVHLREEAMLLLGTGGSPAAALDRAAANFRIQREAIDARLLARAATNVGDSHALAQLRNWRSRTGFKDRFVDALLAQAGT